MKNSSTYSYMKNYPESGVFKENHKIMCIEKKTDCSGKQKSLFANLAGNGACMNKDVGSKWTRNE